MSDANKLSDAQIERLSILSEECGEVILAIGKILRHGYHSKNPDLPSGGRDNKRDLERELGHVFASVEILNRAGDVNLFEIVEESATKIVKIKAWLHETHPGVNS